MYKVDLHTLNVYYIDKAKRFEQPFDLYYSSWPPVSWKSRIHKGVILCCSLTYRARHETIKSENVPHLYKKLCAKEPDLRYNPRSWDMHMHEVRLNKNETS